MTKDLDLTAEQKAALGERAKIEVRFVPNAGERLGPYTATPPMVSRAWLNDDQARQISPGRQLMRIDSAEGAAYYWVKRRRSYPKRQQTCFWLEPATPPVTRL